MGGTVLLLGKKEGMILIWEISQHTHIRLSTEASTPIIIIFSSPRWHGWNVIPSSTEPRPRPSSVAFGLTQAA